MARRAPGWRCWARGHWRSGTWSTPRGCGGRTSRWSAADRGDGLRSKEDAIRFFVRYQLGSLRQSITTMLKGDLGCMILSGLYPYIIRGHDSKVTKKHLGRPKAAGEPEAPHAAEGARAGLLLPRGRPGPERRHGGDRRGVRAASGAALGLGQAALSA